MQVMGCESAKNISDVEEVFGIVSKIIFGSRFDLEILDQAEDRVVLKVNECPLFNKARDEKRDLEKLSTTCHDYCKSVVEKLNPMCTQRFAKSMCCGDIHCESVIELK